MKKLIYLIFLLACISCSKNNESNVEPKFYTSDIDLFWKTFDEIKPNFSKADFQTLYIDKGTKGLKDYAAQKNLAFALENILSLNEYLDYYNSIRDNTKNLTLEIEKTKIGFEKLIEIYPDAKLFNVYFLIGSLTAGGRVSENGLLIAAEMFSKTDTTNLDKLNIWHQNVIKTKNYIPSVVTHELIHKQQHFAPKNLQYPTLLEQSILEGMADYISRYLLPDVPNINDHLFEYADPIEQDIWNAFKLEKDLNYSNTNNWLYNGGNVSSTTPADLGYYVGYKILESYSAKFSNKLEAIQSMLSTSNYYDIFDMSKYEEKFNK